MSIQKNLTFLLHQKRLNANALSELTDGALSQPTTRRILEGMGENSRDSTLDKYAKFFQVSLYDLKYGDIEKGLSISPSQAVESKALSAWGDEASLDSDDVELPYFKEVLFVAGSGTAHVIEEVGKKLRFSKRILRNAGVEIENAASATNSGDAMANTILDGADLGIDKSRQVIRDGKIYAFDHGGMLRVKRLYRQPFGSIKLVSDNKDFEDEVLTAEQWSNDVTLLGWVFWWSTVDRW